MAHAWISLLFGSVGWSNVEVGLSIHHAVTLCDSFCPFLAAWGTKVVEWNGVYSILGLCEDTQLVVAVWCIIMFMVNVERSKLFCVQVFLQTS
jgi:hypothetical protein